MLDKSRTGRPDIPEGWSTIVHASGSAGPAPTLSPGILEALLPHGTRSLHRAKNTILREGETPAAIYFILRGSVRVLMEDEEGRELILAYLGPGEFFGELGLFENDAKRSAWVLTRTECEILVVSYERFRALCHGSPEVLMHLAGQMAARLRATSRRMGHLAFLDVTGRIARALLDLARDSQAITHPDGMLLRITREELGRLVNCSREMAGRVLQDLEAQGLIEVDGKSIVVHGTR